MDTKQIIHGQYECLYIHTIHIPYNTPHISDIHTQKSHAGRRKQGLPLVRLPFVRLHPPQLRDDLSSRNCLVVGAGHPSEKYGPSSGMRTEPQLINGKMPKMATKPPTSYYIMINHRQFNGVMMGKYVPNHQPGKVSFFDGPLTIFSDCAEVARVAQLMTSL